MIDPSNCTNTSNQSVFDKIDLANWIIVRVPFDKRVAGKYNYYIAVVVKV